MHGMLSENSTELYTNACRILWKTVIFYSTHMYNVCMYVCKYVCVYVCLFVCIYVCMYVCMYVCISLSIHLSIQGGPERMQHFRSPISKKSET